MAKTKDEPSTVEKFQAAQAAILAKSDELKQLQHELEELKADYRSLVDELPYEVKQLFLFQSPNGSESHGSPKLTASGKRTRMTAQQLEELQGEILTQLKANAEPIGRSGFDFGEYDATRWMQQVAKLVKAGKVKKIGEKSKAVYTLGKK